MMSYEVAEAEASVNVKELKTKPELFVKYLRKELKKSQIMKLKIE